jgi:hypothetical protein
MITWTWEGGNQAQCTVMGRQLCRARRMGLTCAARDQVGVDVGGGIDRIPSHSSMSFSGRDCSSRLACRPPRLADVPGQPGNALWTGFRVSADQQTWTPRWRTATRRWPLLRPITTTGPDVFPTWKSRAALSLPGPRWRCAGVDGRPVLQFYVPELVVAVQGAGLGVDAGPRRWAWPGAA